MNNEVKAAAAKERAVATTEFLNAKLPAPPTLRDYVHAKAAQVGKVIDRLRDRASRA